jgi:hypothetical protein
MQSTEVQVESPFYSKNKQMLNLLREMSLQPIKSSQIEWIKDAGILLISYCFCCASKKVELSETYITWKGGTKWKTTPSVNIQEKKTEREKGEEPNV